jgi:hypothetical protein
MKIPQNSTNAIRGKTSAKRPDLFEKVRSGEMDPQEARHIAVSDGLKGNDLPRTIAELAEDAKIPEGRQREWFGSAVINAIFDCWKVEENIDESLELLENESFAKAADALKFARTALAQVDDSCRPYVEGVEKSIDEFLRTLFGETPAGRWQEAGSSHHQHRLAHSGSKRPLRRGRPSGTVKHPASQNFVFQLLECATMAEGNFSFEKYLGRGSLIKALKKLAPYLPEGLDPHKLPRTTLQRIKTAQGRRHGESRASRTKY